MPPKARLVKIGRPKPVTDPRVATNPNEVCIGVIDSATQKGPVWYACHRDDYVNVLFRKLRTTFNIEDKVLRNGKVCISRYSDITFRQVLPDSEDIAEFLALLPDEESPFDDKIEKDDQSKEFNAKSQRKKSYGSIRKKATATTAIELHRKVAGKALDTLEAVVRGGEAELNSLHSLLQDSHFSNESQAKDWLEDIKNILPQAKTPPTVIGIVGDTGSGKSSMLNALLDQDIFIPVSSHRACTATITEISYNKDSEGFRAVIEFIDATSWSTEVRYLYDDHKANAEKSEEEASDHVAATALAKLQIVYPYLTKSNLSQFSPAQLMSDDEVSLKLGGQHVIEESDAQRFYAELKKFVDSGEKTGEGGSRTRRFWPLIKVVKVYIKHDVLANGVTLVDLPGGHDANAARAKIAEEYFINCSGYLVVALLNRAADNSFAQKIIDKTFRRQLSMDSGFFKNIITFVCSKSDDQDFRHTIETFPQDLKASLENLEAVETREKTETERLDKEKDLLEEKLSKIRSDDVEDEEERGRLEELFLRLQDDDSNATGPDPNTLTPSQIMARIGAIWKKKRASKGRRDELNNDLDNIKLEKSALKVGVLRAKLELDVQCVARLCRAAEDAVRYEFSAEIASIDQELMQKANEDDFNPEKALRDYEELRARLPVFAISARAYQALSRSAGESEQFRGLPTMQHTNIPQLQQHCRDLSTKARITSCDQFLTSLSELLNSLILWSGHGGSGADLSAEEVEKLQGECKKDLTKLENTLNTEVQGFTKTLDERLQDQLCKVLSKERVNARPKSIEIVKAWNNDTTSFPWSTYKAICRRNGAFRNPEQNWNKTLTEPLMQSIGKPWADFFNQGLEEIVSDFVESCNRYLQTTITQLLYTAGRLGTNPTTLAVLRAQMKNHQKRLDQVKDTTLKMIRIRQREYNRTFVPAIERGMITVYREVADITGRGSLKKMHAKMLEYVSRTKGHVYYNAVNEVNKTLNGLVPEMEKLVGKQIEEVNRRIARDCLGLTTPPTAAQLKCREQINNYIDQAKARFKHILDGDLTEVPQHDASKSEGLFHDDDSTDDIVKCEPASK